MKPVILLRTAILVSILLVAEGVEVMSEATPFVHEIVAATGSVGEYTSLAFDPHGNPHISFFDTTTDDLKYASKSAGTWSIETVDATGDVGWFTSLTLDAQGNPHISYFDNTNDDLKYATRSSGVWTIQTVSTDLGNFAPQNSLALDPQGNPHITFAKTSTGALMYASKSGGVWTADSVTVGGSAVSLALDALGRPHIIYYSIQIASVRYASKPGGVWVLESVAAATGLFNSSTSLALDAQGNPRFSYYADGPADLGYASKTGAVWTVETVDATGTVGFHNSLALDVQGNPHISYNDPSNGDLKYASRSGGVWTLEAVDVLGSVGAYTSLTLDSQSNPRISYWDGTNGDLRYTDAAVHVVAPLGGETWPVGSLRSIVWSGVGPVNVLLSVDGGRSFDLIGEGLTENSWEFRVPHAPTRFAALRVHRSSPLSIAATDSFLTIEASISLLAFKAEPVGGGVLLSWHTDPGPADLAGYKLERHEGSGWRTVVGLTQEIAYTDPEGKPGDRYRLSGINGLGEELALGEVAVTPRALLAAWPLPYRQGDLSISFAAAAGPGGIAALTEVSLYDLSGRLVRTIFRQSLPSGYYTATWDGRDDLGEKVPSGLYFLHSRTAGSENTYKVTVLR